MKKILKHLTRGLLWTVVLSFMAIFVVIKTSWMQGIMGEKASELLCQTLCTEVSVGSIDLRLPNRIIMDDVLLYDQEKKEMLKVARISAAVDILDIFDDKIRISSAQIFGMKAALRKKNAEADLNCQFVLDSLASKDTTQHTPLDLAINSLIIRNSAISFDREDIPLTPGRFTPHHLDITKLSSHIILHHLTDDNINVQVKRLSFEEASGFRLTDLKIEADASEGNIKVNDFLLTLPHSTIKAPVLNVAYAKENNRLKPGSLNFKTKVTAQQVAVEDIAMFIPRNIASQLPDLQLNIDADGTDKEAVAYINASSPHSNDISLAIDINANDWLTDPNGTVVLKKLHVSEKTIASVSELVSIPAQLKQLGDIDVKGKATMYSLSHFTADSEISTSRAGKVSLDGKYNDGDIMAKVTAPSLDLARILDSKVFGPLKCDLNLTASLNKSTHALAAASAHGTISQIVFEGHSYDDIKVNADYTANGIKGNISIDDDRLRFDATADLIGHDVDDFIGNIDISNFYFDNPKGKREVATLDRLSLSSQPIEQGKRIELTTDFCDISLEGAVKPTEVPQAFINIISHYLPSIPGFPKEKPVNANFAFIVKVQDLNFLDKFADMPVKLSKPVNISGTVNGYECTADIAISAPNLTVDDKNITDSHISLWTLDNRLNTSIRTQYHDSEETSIALTLDGHAQNNEFYSTLSWDNQRPSIFMGKINTLTRFYHAMGGGSGYEICMPESFFQVGNSLWGISADNIVYDEGTLTVDRFLVDNDTQRLFIDGKVSDKAEDSLTVQLNDINVEYILDLVNFDAVDFNGRASGTAIGHAIAGNLFASADLMVKDFTFQKGTMGDMHIDAAYSNESEQIDITALCNDSIGRGKTHINGYVSPQRNYIDLDIRAENTRLDFVQDFCKSFLRESALHGDGGVRLFGPLSDINLEGKLIANGSFALNATNCTYTLYGDTVTFIPDDIQLHNAPFHDMYGNTGYLSGGIHHQSLSQLSYDLTATTKKLLAYDFPELGDEIFCGRAIVGGNIGIHGKGNELNIQADCSALDNSYIIFNATSPDAIASQDFITWGSANDKKQDAEVVAATATQNIAPNNSNLDSGNDRTNIHMRFNVNVTPSSKLHVIMDANTGDYIDLYGSGTLRASYFNKGKFLLYGNYGIDHGTYKMTIQNVIRRDFDFLKGSTIAFGGDPYEATLNMQARYSLNSVSLADLNIGTSFKTNNVPVNCLMNITGTPGKPNVAFDMDLPSLSSDMRQMVHSVINSAEEMNQQVLYLLAIGRFYAPTNMNNAEDQGRISQGELAMQSFLSGTLSQQFNTMMSSVMGKLTRNNWSFGANISPGNEGMSNAEYEGLVSGRALNNRLIFNGQFGYRDNVNTNTQNFIGDFNIQYLLTPNGTISLKAYNQSNDRYFTKSSLNTQGIGIMFQREFGK